MLPGTHPYMKTDPVFEFLPYNSVFAYASDMTARGKSAVSIHRGGVHFHVLVLLITGRSEMANGKVEIPMKDSVDFLIFCPIPISE